ncbi:MAG: N-acetyl-gamma-glutamyl-phosphate reductase [Myxococcota bacterium]
MSAPKVFIDGHAGTTGLRIRDWLAGRDDLELVTLPEEDRKNAEARRERLLASDLTVLCLPDQAAEEAAKWAEDSAVRLLDSSSVHRVAPGWVYGLPELTPDRREAIRQAKQVSNPGCYGSAFLLCLRPLVDAELLSAATPISVHALSGYSGGGRTLIEKWEDPESDLSSLPFEAPYGLERAHKHIPEMRSHSGLELDPQFIPAVGPFACGMRVEIPLHANWLDPATTAERVAKTWADRYRDEPFVHIHPAPAAESPHEKSFDPRTCNDSNRIELHVVPHASGHLLLIAILDNLGKGAAGVAIQNLNLMLGCDETTGLVG